MFYMFSASDMRASLRTDLQSNAPILESWIKKKVQFILPDRPLLVERCLPYDRKKE
jgi:hypothetical protein